MKTEKMNFKNIKDVLSRDEMKEIMAGYIGCYFFLSAGGQAVNYGGSCASGSYNACMIAANQQCDQYISWGYSSCYPVCGY